MAKIIYVCKKHNDKILFEEEIEEGSQILQLVLPQNDLQHCDECEKYYYKSECKKINQ